MSSSTKPIPKRVLLRGFDKQGRTQAIEYLQTRGVEVISLAELAELTLAGPEADAALLQKARVRGAKVMRWDDFIPLLTAAHPKTLGAEAGTDIFVSDVTLTPALESKATVPIEKGATHLRILDLEIPLPQTAPEHRARIPDAAQFAHLCHDRPLLETLRAVVLGVLYNIPVALEGETAASKTSAILYAAHLLGQPIVRLNLNGHTDAGELVGRYVPADAGSLIDWSTLSSASPWLRPDSRKILASAEAEQRLPSPQERLAVLGREQWPASSWRFQEGYLPQALRHGYWILLDEMNLAESQVLERLNPALENPPGLVLTEGDGTVFGRGGDVPVHGQFRMLATMNPSEYAGRATLSPAFADRWGVWHQAEGPGEREIEQSLRTLVYGEQPRVLVGGRAYRAHDTPALYPELQSIRDIDSLLQRVAVFHHGIFKASGGGGGTPSIGRLRKERYSFSRRILLNLVRYVAERIRAGSEAADALLSEGIQLLYLARLRDPADKKAVSNMLRAGGLQ